MLKCFVKQYSHQRIKQIMEADYGITLVKNTGYKLNRYQRFATYQMFDSKDNILAKSVTLDSLREFLTRKNYPLTDDCRPN